MVEEVDERGNSTFYEYDEAGRNTKVIDAQGNETVYEYDLKGQRTAVIDARGHRTESVYDAAGRLVRTIYPDTTESSVSYDALGQKIAETDPAGRTTRFEYDQTGNLTAVIDALDQRTEYAYDEQGNRIAQTDSNGHTTTWTFDATGRMLSRTLPLGQTEYYQYDMAGQRTARTDFNGQTTQFAYDDLSRPTRTEHPDGSMVETRYTTSGQVREIEVTCSPAPCVAEGRELGVTVQQYDERDRLTRIQYPDGRWIEYSYDALYRLTEEQATDPRGNRITTYTYDATGNRLSRTVTCDPQCSREIEAGVTTYVYDANDRLLEESGPDGVTTYSYDENGNTLQKSAPDGTVDYTYNTEDRLTQASGALESGIATEYSYDAQGIRQRQTVDGITSRFLVDPTHQYAQVLEELDAAGNSTVTYVIGHERIRQERAEGHFTYHDDGLGSIRVLTDDTGRATDTYVYEAFGQLEHGEGTTPNKFRYTGEQYDPNLGFYYLRARYYNPATGRFPTMDTYQGRIHEPQTLHKYLYVHGDPANNADPSGNMTLGGLSAGMNISASLSLRAVGLASRSLIKRVVTGSLQAARAALHEARRCIRNPRGCRLTVPILVVGTETRETAEHIQDAQLGRGSALMHSPFWLTRKSPPHSRSWIRNAMPCRTKVSGVTSCDEYPFASTQEGGRGNRARVSLRPVPVREQSVQGGRLSAFYRACRVSPVRTSSNPLKDRRRFLTVATTSAPGFWICPR